MQLHTNVIPLLATFRSKADAADPHLSMGSDPEKFLEWMTAFGATIWNDEIKKAVAFDCRSLPASFVEHTGVECGAEIVDGSALPNLPFPNCWFEFQNFAIHAYTLGAGDREELNHTAGFHVHPLPMTENSVLRTSDSGCNGELWTARDFADNGGPKFNDDSQNSFEKFGFDVDIVGADDPGVLATYRTGGRYLLGLLALFEERMLISNWEVAAIDPNKIRKLAKAGARQEPKAYRVLTLNLAEARRRATPADGHHESPRLHWRRGHSRTIHRGSEFEKRTWVRRCLVGDPSKGFVEKHYRPVWRPSIH